MLAAFKDLNIQARVLMGEEGWLTQRLRDLEGLAGVADYPSFRAPLSRLLKLGRFSRDVSEMWEKFGPFDIIHANDIWDALPAQWLASNHNRPWVVHLRTQVTETQYYNHHLNKAHAVMAVSPLIYEMAKGWRHRLLEFIPDGLSEQEFWPIEERDCPGPREIGVIGHGGAVKGWDVFARAMQRVAATGGALPARVVFLGEIELKSQKSLAARLPAAADAEFAGRIEGFAQRLRSLDLVISPSRQESFGMAMVEAIAAGVPLLASRTGIIPYLIGGADSPWTFTPGDPESLVLAWGRLPELWPARYEAIRRWQEKLRREFMVGQSAEKLIRVYHSLLAFNHGPR
jgi:glycosyltransferase involved in cell wall biosynthesis